MTSPLDLDLFGGIDGDRVQPLGTRIVNRNVADQIVDRLVTAIALGVYVPGQRLPALRELADMMQVSPTVVREALHRLAEAGYLEIRRGRNGGSFVASAWRPESTAMVAEYLLPNWKRFEAIFDARNLIEPLIARTAAERRTKRDLRAIMRALRLYEDAADREASGRADEQLHRSIAEATHNPVLVGMSTKIRSLLSFNLGAEPYTKKIRETAARQHTELARAVEDGDGDLAADIAREHITYTEKRIRNLVRRVRREQAAAARDGDDPGTGTG